jgi:hypothetical protein
MPYPRTGRPSAVDVDQDDALSEIFAKYARR